MVTSVVVAAVVVVGYMGECGFDCLGSGIAVVAVLLPCIFELWKHWKP